ALEQHLLLGGEVEIEAAAADPRPIGDVLDARGHDAVLAERLQRRLVDALTGLFALLPPAHSHPYTTMCEKRLPARPEQRESAGVSVKESGAAHGPDLAVAKKASERHPTQPVE